MNGQQKPALAAMIRVSTEEAITATVNAVQVAAISVIRRLLPARPFLFVSYFICETKLYENRNYEI